jgi:hypothetical protein
MGGEEELDFLKAHLVELTPNVLRQLKRDIVAEKKRREAEAAAKAKGSGERATGQPSGRQPGSPTASGPLSATCGPEGWRPCTSMCRLSCNSGQSGDGIRTPRRNVP